MDVSGINAGMPGIELRGGKFPGIATPPTLTPEVLSCAGEEDVVAAGKPELAAEPLRGPGGITGIVGAPACSGLVVFPKVRPAML